MKRLINGLFSSVPDAQIVTNFLEIAADLPPDDTPEMQSDVSQDPPALS
jgi:hypothetical protein